MDRYKLNDRVIVEKGEWGGNGTSESPCRRIDSPGTITSVKGITKGHTNNHKYEITLDSGVCIIYSNNKTGTGGYIFKKLK